MSEEEKKQINLIELLEQSQMTFTEAEEKSKQEAGRPQVERYRIGEDGEYPLRILPLVPNFDDEGRMLPLERKGYEYPIQQQFIAIELPTKKGKNPKVINIPVVRTTDKNVGYSVDLIDTYAKIVKQLYPDDTDLIEKMNKSSFKNPSSLKWSFQHAMYVLDVSKDKNRDKGPQLWQCTHTVYKAIDDAKMRLWRNMIAKNPKASDPVAGISNSYDVTIIRGNTNGKTDYTVEIGRDFDDLEKEEIERLVDMPRIPELIFHFTRYQLEAEIAFLQQYDDKHGLDICKESDFLEAVETLKGELPADDTSHFDVTTAGSDKDNGANSKATVDSLWDEYDRIVDEGLDERSDEYQSLREKIRQFAEDNELDVRLSRSKNNKQLLEEVEEAFDSQQRDTKKVEKAEKSDDESDKKEEKPVKRSRRSRADEDEGDDDEDEDKAEEQPVRRRRPRPSVDEEPDEDKSSDKDEDEKETDEESDDKDKDEAPAETERALHRRRRR